jgi:hypothetical protein
MKEKLRKTCVNPDWTNGAMKSLKHPPKKKPSANIKLTD